METKCVSKTKAKFIETKIKKDAKEKICKHDAEEYIIEDQHEGTVICSKCGTVILDQVVCELSEWRTFADDTQADSWQRSRVGGASNRFLSSQTNLSTSIQSTTGKPRNDDSFNSSILRTVNRKSVDNGIYHGLKQLNEMAERIHLTQSVLEYAHYLYYKMYKKGKFKGIALTSDAKVGACLYIACYHAQCPRTVNEICGISENSHHSIRRAIRRISKMLNLPVGSIDCRDVLPRYCAWLLLPHHMEREVINVATSLNKLDDQQQFDVEIVSATAIYVVTQQSLSHKRSKAEIANSLGISIEDLTFCYNYFLEK